VTEPLNRFAGAALDRATDRRTDATWLARRLGDSSSRVVPVWEAHSLVSREEPLHPILLPADHPVARDTGAVGPIFLGLDEVGALFAVGVRTSGNDRPPLEDLGEFKNLHRIGALLGQEAGALLAYARAMVAWHERHRFCGTCGQPTESAEGGHLRRCTDDACRSEHYPRTDPAIIVLVEDGDRCLLGRKAEWPPGMHSTIAGFVEPGENLREAVIREVLEETGIEVGEVAFHSSQPWPFPSSLMLGFMATRVGGELRVDPMELEDARWFERARIRELVVAGELRLPGRVSIARRLIEEWLGPE
jgi:NAD+ diphosphatase